MDWRIYYDDGTTFSSYQGTPEAAPSLGIIAIVQPDPEVGRHIVCKFDFYYYRQFQWWGADLIGMVDQFLHCGARALKAGRTVSNQQFRDIYESAKDDPDFPNKSAWRADERHP